MGSLLLKTLPRTVHTKPILDYIFIFILFFRKILNQSHWPYVRTFSLKKMTWAVTYMKWLLCLSLIDFSVILENHAKHITEFR